MRKILHVGGITLFTLTTEVATAQDATFARAFSRFPFKGNPATLIAGRDGYLYGANREAFPRRGGLVYRVAPDGEFKTLKSFEFLINSPQPNDSGSEPDNKFVMGRDGCIYGLTMNGGVYGRGVLYRIRPDGQFSVVADLDPGMLPGGTLEYYYFSYTARGFVEGPDGAFYTCVSPRGGVVRIGRDGQMSVVGQAGYFTRAFSNPEEPAELITVDVRDWERRVQMKRVRLTDATILEEVMSPVFTAPESVAAIGWSPDGLLLYATWIESSAFVGRLDLLKSDGTVEELSRFDWVDGNDVPPLIASFTHCANDGTLYYSASPSQKGLAGGGNTLVELKPDGSYRTVCGFGEFGYFNVVGTPDGSLFGATFAPGYYLPKGGDTSYSEDWMSPSNSGNFIKKNQRRVGGSFFQVSLKGASSSNLPPLADIDVMMAKGAATRTVSPLQNDRDPEGSPIHLVSAGPATRGSVIVETRRNGNSTLIYTPTDGGRRSAVIPYQVADSGGLKSTGTVLFRGDCRGVYQDDQFLVAGRPFTLWVKSNGDFSTTLPAPAGKPVSVSGELDWDDQGFAAAIASENMTVTLMIAPDVGDGEELFFDYQIRYSDGSSFLGRASR